MKNYNEIKQFLIANNIFDKVKICFKQNGGASTNEIAAILVVKINMDEAEARTLAANMINNYSDFFRLEN
jgi:L-rhamnose isomerase